MNDADCVNFFTPVRFSGEAVTVGQTALTLIDSLFYFGGRVAVVAPEHSEDGYTGTIVHEEEMPWWQTASKVVVCAALVLPVISTMTWTIPAGLFISKAVLRYGYDFRVSGQTLPDGTKEIGTITDGILFHGTRTKVGEEAIFISPKLLLGEVELEGEEIELNFAEVWLEGRREVIPVVKPYNKDKPFYGKNYIRYPGSPYEALLKIAQDKTKRYGWVGSLHYGSPIMHLLQHPHNHLLTAQGVLACLTSVNSEGSIALHSLNRESLMEALQLMQDHGVAIDLHKIDPVTKETLFSQWAGSGFEHVTRKLLEIDPTAISQTKGRETSFFAKALDEGKEKEARVLLQAMEAQKIRCTLHDAWLKRAFLNDCNFTKKSFDKLPEGLKRKLWKVANVFVHKEFLQKLRDFGMKRLQPQLAPIGPAIFSSSMDAIDVEHALKTFFADLRKENLLLTKEEFSKKERSLYISKGRDLGRILGRNYIEREIKRLGLRHVKVPKKTAVIQPEEKEQTSIQCSISTAGDMKLYCSDIEVYAEKITAIKRFASKEMMLEFLELLRVTGFNDFFGYNFFMGRNERGEEGIYCIDTEYTNFSSLPCYSNIGSIGSLMKEEDHQWLERELNQRFDDFKANREALVEALSQKWEEEKPHFIENGFKDRKPRPFILPIADLTHSA